MSNTEATHWSGGWWHGVGRTEQITNEQTRNLDCSVLIPVDSQYPQPVFSVALHSLGTDVFPVCKGVVNSALCKGGCDLWIPCGNDPGAVWSVRSWTVHLVYFNFPAGHRGVQPFCCSLEAIKHLSLWFSMDSELKVLVLGVYLSALCAKAHWLNFSLITCL